MLDTVTQKECYKKSNTHPIVKPYLEFFPSAVDEGEMWLSTLCGNKLEGFLHTFAINCSTKQRCPNSQSCPIHSAQINQLKRVNSKTFPRNLTSSGCILCGGGIFLVFRKRKYAFYVFFCFYYPMQTHFCSFHKITLKHQLRPSAFVFVARGLPGVRLE